MQIALDGVGAISEELEDEYYIWKAVQKGQSLFEILNYWDLDDLRRWIAICEQKAWYEEVASLYYKDKNRKRAKGLK